MNWQVEAESSEAALSLKGSFRCGLGEGQRAEISTILSRHKAEAGQGVYTTMEGGGRERKEYLVLN